jgi:hypothetical protein
LGALLVAGGVAGDDGPSSSMLLWIVTGAVSFCAFTFDSNREISGSLSPARPRPC